MSIHLIFRDKDILSSYIKSVENAFDKVGVIFNTYRPNW